MNVGSVFSGVGLLDLGLCRAGMRIAWHCEADPWRRDILAKRWPGVSCYEDIRDVGGDCPPIDILAGGPPCQPISLAGKGLAQDDERWLWPEYVRALRELRPRYALMENPSALLARGLGDVLGQLAEVGYDAEWFSFPASALGAPHRRDRTFIVAYPDEAELREQPRGRGRSRGSGPAPELGDDGEHGDVPDADGGAVDPRWQRRGATKGDSGSAPEADPRGFARVSERDGRTAPRLDWSLGDDAQRLGVDYWRAQRPPEPCLRSLADGGPRMVGRSHMLGALGDGVVVAVGQWVGERLMAADSSSE